MSKCFRWKIVFSKAIVVVVGSLCWVITVQLFKNDVFNDIFAFKILHPAVIFYLGEGEQILYYSFRFLKYPYLAKKNKKCNFFFFISKLLYQLVCPFSEQRGLLAIFQQ